MEDISEINATAVKRMYESVGWAELERELKLMIEDLRDMLEDSDDDLARGRISALRTILAWPEAVIESERIASMDKILTEDDLNGAE